MKRKSRAYITIYALYMIFVLMIVIVFLLVQVKNIRTLNTYKYNYIKAKANAYSTVQIINTRKLFDEKLNGNFTKDFNIQIEEIPEPTGTDVNFYEEKGGDRKVFSFMSYYPDNNGSYVITKMVYKRKNPFEEKIIPEEKIEELLPEITEGRQSLGIKHCFVFSLNNKTYFVDKNIVDQKYEEYAQEKSKGNNEEVVENGDKNIFEKRDEDAKIEMDEEFLTKLVEFSTKKKNIVVDADDITIFNDVTIEGIFIDKNNVYYVEDKTTRKNPEITVNGILILKNAQAYDYKVKGEYLSTKKVDINFTEDKKVYKSKKYEFAGSYYE
ncbi:hypothetical protein [Finegoldia magna]|uniref:hypothetical protein n=1 Tax=Finegoldia magna TaxID=1260 RepID=UPI0029140F8C|nr:hypothetical protein [Finegoldia magna]MDU4731008.1 hypothetical protein [Finegoldia magna]